MSNEVDDDEAFLYGSEDEGDSQVSKKLKLESKAEAQKDSNIETKEGDDEQDDDQADEDDDEDEDGDNDDDDNDDEDSDSDSDIEFIIGSEEPKAGSGTAQEGQPQQSGTSAAPSTAGVTVPEAIDEITDPSQGEVPISDPSNQITTTDATITRIPGVDINKVGEFEGKPITSINLQDLKEKPWRQPGADISEYFNFGFDEFTWTAYCSKQDKLRSDFNPQKVMMSMMPMGLPPMMMGMPGFQMPPSGQMPPIPQPPQQLPPPPQQQQQQQPPQQQQQQQPPLLQQQQQQQFQQQHQLSGVPNIPTGPGQGINPPQQQNEEKAMPLNPNLPRAPRERSVDPRDRVEKENSWGGSNENYRDRERRNRGGRR